MTPTKIIRRHRLRQAAGLAGVGVVAATAVGVALPSLAQSDENATAASAPAEAPATKNIAETAPAAVPEVQTVEQQALQQLEASTPEERQAFIQMFWTPEQKFAFTYYLMTQEQRDAFPLIFQTPAPAPAPAYTPKGAPAQQQYKPAASTNRSSGGGGAPGGFLACVRNRESRGQYSAYNPSGASGAYQLMPQTARNTANHAGRPDLANRPVSSWSKADQDAMAQHLYSWQGAAPWGGGC